MSYSETLFSISGLFTVLAAHPFVTYRPSLTLLKRMGVAPPLKAIPEAVATPRSFAVCVAAYNEEAVIEDKARNLLALRRHSQLPVDLLVYVDAASDDTLRRIQPYGDRIRLVVGERRLGKTAGMNRLVSMTEADILVFTDANVMVRADALDRLSRYFADPKVGCVCGHLLYANGADSPTADVGTRYWRAEESLKQLESDTGGVIGADGSIFAIRRSLHRPVPDHIIDDFYLSLAILCDGHAVVRAGDLRASESAATVSADEYRRKRRISCQAFNVHRLLRHRLAGLHWSLRYKYVSHKLLRWFSLINAGCGGACLLAGCALAGAWMPAAILAIPGVLGLCLARPREILLSLAGTTHGLVNSLAGERFQTWTPAASRATRPAGS